MKTDKPGRDIPMAKPVRAKIYYQIEEKICERGDYVINNKRVPGYRNYYYRSALWLIWRLPRSKSKLLKSVKKWKWKHPGIEYDQSKMDLEKRCQEHYTDFSLDDKKILHYDGFHGLESTIYTQIRNKNGPSEISIFFDDGQEIFIKPVDREKVLKRLQKLLN
jgi:hypothetical protein